MWYPSKCSDCSVCSRRSHEKCCVECFCSVLHLNLGLHETLALLTSQLRPDSNHKEEMGFLRDVFSERSLSYLMKVKVYIYVCTFSLPFTFSLFPWFIKHLLCQSFFFENSVPTKAYVCLSTNINNVWQLAYFVQK